MIQFYRFWDFPSHFLLNSWIRLMELARPSLAHERVHKGWRATRWKGHEAPSDGTAMLYPALYYLALGLMYVKETILFKL